MRSAVLAVLHTAWRTELFKQFHGYQSVPWLRRLVRPLSAEAQVRARDMGFVVVKVEMGQVNLRVLRFYPVSIIPQYLSVLISSGG
jgi:hypothetical protein